MKFPKTTATIVYCSPSGATKHVAGQIKKSLQALDIPVKSISVCKQADFQAAFQASSRGYAEYRLLFIGSPVYALHPLPPVMDFIERIPASKKSLAIPFVTWGGVCSGAALYAMGKALANKELPLIGAARIVAKHSMSWGFKQPLCPGHPNEKDNAILQTLAQKACEKITNPQIISIPLSRLSHYSSPQLDKMLTNTFEKAKSRLPSLSINTNACTQCQECSDVCPVACISFSPYPVIGDTCIYCYNCAKTCPTQAIASNFLKSEILIKKRIEALREPQKSAVIV